MAAYRFQSPNPAQDTGKTARFTVIRDADGFYWNQSLNTGAGGFEAYSSADYTAAKYLVSMIEGRKGQWSGTFPANVAANTVVTLQPFYDTTAGTPADSDLAAAAAADFLWDGTILYPYTGANVVQVGGVGPVETVGNVGTGSGRYPIDQNGGTGAGGVSATFYIPHTNVTGVTSSTNVLEFTSNGTAPVGGLTVTAYLAGAYDAGTRTSLASTTTNADGTWAAPLSLNSGTYYLIADSTADGFQAMQVKVVVP